MSRPKLLDLTSKMLLYVFSWSLVCVGAYGLNAQEATVKFTERPAQAFCYGVLQDEQGKLIDGASITLVQPLNAMFESIFTPLLAEPVALKARAEAGKFEVKLDIADEKFWSGAGKCLLVVQAAGFATNVQEVANDRLWVDAPFEVKLRRCTALELHLLDESGMPLPDAEVTISMVMDARVPDRIAASGRYRADRNGLVSLPGYDADNLQQVIVRSERYGIQRLEVVQEGGRFVARAMTLGKVLGKLEVADLENSPSLAGVRMWIASFQNSAYVATGPPTMSWQEVTLDADGKFEASQVAVGSLTMHLPPSEDFPYVPSQQTLASTPALTKDAGGLNWMLEFLAARPVVFQFVDADSQPITNLDIASTGLRNSYRTDELGKFTHWFPREATFDGQLFAFDAFDRFEEPPFGIKLVSLKTDSEGNPLPIPLARSHALSGRVVDEEGRSVSSAAVRAAFASERFNMQAEASTDQTGLFTLRGLPANATLSISAQKDRLMTDPKELLQATAGSNESVELVIGQQPMAQLSGKVLSAAGPVGDAVVTLNRAVVGQKESFSAERLSAAPIELERKQVRTDASGNFKFDPIVNFQDRFQIVVQAEGFRPYTSPFLNGSSRTLQAGQLDLGQFKLVPSPPRLRSRIRIMDSTNDPVADAEVACVGPRTGRVMARTNADGIAELDLLNASQVIAVRAPGFQTLFEALDACDPEMTFKLAAFSEAAAIQRVAWFERDRQQELNYAKQLLGKLTMPGATDSTYYRQSRYFVALATADFGSFMQIMLAPDCPYEYRGQFALTVAGIGFRNAPTESIALLKSQAPSTEIKASVLANFAFLSSDIDLKEELYGEAILELGNCSGDAKLTGCGYVALSLALDDRVETAQALLEDVWADADEVQKILTDGERVHKRAVARIFAPRLAMVDVSAALKLLKLTADDRELDSLKSQALAMYSLASPDVALARAKAEGIDLGAGVDSIFTYSQTPVIVRPHLIEWAKKVALALDDSATKLKLFLFAARHSDAGSERLEMIAQAVTAWRNTNVDFWYHWSDPTKTTLEELMSFDDLRAAELDELLFASFAVGPSQFDSFNTLCTLANTARLAAMRDPQLCQRLLEPIFEDTQWMYGNGLLSSTKWQCHSNTPMVRRNSSRITCRQHR